MVIASLALSDQGALPTWAWWLVHSAVQPERVLPLFGFGLALALVGIPVGFVSLIGLAVGTVAGLAGGETWDMVFASVPSAFENAYYTGAMACIAVGIALIAGTHIRRVFLPIAGMCLGAMLGLCIVLTNPELGNRTVPFVGLFYGIWLVGTVCLTTTAFRQQWFSISARILGSWLLAIGILYGGTSVFKKPVPLQPLPSIIDLSNKPTQPGSFGGSPDTGQPDGRFLQPGGSTAY